MADNQNLTKLVSMINSGKKIPALQLVKSEPEVAALISKLIKPRDNTNSVHGLRDEYNDLNQGHLQAITDGVKSRIRDNENITQLFPDIELAIQILVSSVLSPKDMVKTDIIYRSVESILPSELTLKLTEILTSNFEGYHKTNEELSTILRDTMFTSGSYVKAVIPESVVDDIINNKTHVTTESMSELFNANNTTVHLGILGSSDTSNKTKVALERFNLNAPSTVYNQKVKVDKDKFIDNFEVTDNYRLLKLPKLMASYRKNAVKALSTVTPSIEATTDKQLSSMQFNSLIYKGNQTETNLMVKLPIKSRIKRKSVGRPLVLRLPSESVIPVYIPGDKTKHIGYFVLVDVDGNPISVDTIDNQAGSSGLAGLNSGQNQPQGSLSSMLIQKAKNNLAAKDNQNITIPQIIKVYGNIIEADLTERLKNGIYGTDMTIGGNEEIYRIMLSRALSNKFTRLIYMPGDYVTYFAFKYFNNGVGKSYLDDLKVLTSLRAIMLFAKVMAQTKNSINITHVGMTLDPNDPDPQKTIEIAQQEVIKLRQNYFPLGINTPTDLVDWIQRAGFEFSYEGHPGLPQTKFEFETKNLQHVLPDSDLDELLRKQTYMALGLSPEIVDNGFNAEFATTVVSNNILLSKRVIQLQDVFTKQLTEYCHKLILNDSCAVHELKEVLMENKGLIEKNMSDEDKEEYGKDSDKYYSTLIDRFVENIVLELPRPDETSLETQTAAFDTFVESLDKTLNFWVSSEIITSDASGEISSNIDTIKAILKAHFVRQWMAENNFMPELGDIVTTDEDGGPTIDIFDVNKNHLEGIIRSTLKFIKSMAPIKTAANLDLTNLGTEPGESGGSDDSGSSDEGGDEGGGDDMGGGMDDFDMGSDEGGGDDAGDGGGDEPPEEEPTDDKATDEENKDIE